MVIYIVHTHAAKDAVEECLIDGITVFDLSSAQSAERTAVLFGDDHIVADIHKTTSQITGICRLKSRIGKTLTSTVGTDEVLEHRHTLLEVGENRVFNIRTSVATTRFLRFSHQTADTRQLLDLSLRTTSTGVHHHIYGIEALVCFLHLLHQHTGKVVIHLIPDTDDLIVSVVIRDLTHIERVHHLLDSSVTLSNHLLLLFRDNDIIEGKRQTALEGHVITHVLDVVKEDSRTSYATSLDYLTDNLLEGAFLEDLIYITYLIRDKGVDHQAARRGLNHLATRHAHLDASVDIHFLLIERDGSLIRREEHESFTLGSRALLSDVIETEHHVLRRHGDRITVGGVKDIMRTEHEQLCLEDSLVR